MAATGTRVYVAWLNNTLNTSNVLFKASSDNGTSFGPVVKVSNAPTGDSSNPQIAASGSYVYILWQQNVSISASDMFFSASSNYGASFGTPADVTSNVNGLATSDVPQLAVAGNSVYIVWRGTTRQGDHWIFAKASATNGSNLASVGSTTISKNAYSTTQPRIAATGTFVYVTWTDTANTRPQTFFSYSTNSGSSFSAPVSLNNSPAGETDLYQAMAIAGNSVYVTWTNDTTFTDNTMFAASTNNGASFSSAVDLYKARVIDLNPGVAASGNSVYVVWTNSSTGGNREVLLRTSSNSGASFGGIVNLSNSAGASNNPSILVSGSSVYVAWAESYLSSIDVSFVSSDDNGATFGSVIDLSPTHGNGLTPTPTLAASGPNVYVAWQDDTQGNGDIFFRGAVSAPTVADVSVTGIVLSRSFAYSGVPANPVSINVTASNPGTVGETFYVSVKANTTLLGNQSVTVAAGGSSIVTFTWYTASMPRGNYTLGAYASQVTGETNLSNNYLSLSGLFPVLLKGDVNRDCTVNILDLALVGIAFTSTPGPPPSPNWNPYSDLNNDKIVNIIDMVNVANNFNASC